MALTDFPITHLPAVFERGLGSSVALTTAVLDANEEKTALVMRAPTTGDITEVGFRSSGLTTGGDVDVRIETVDAATGQPSGTLWAANTNVTVTINAANTWYTATLTASASVVAGTSVFAVVIQHANDAGVYQISTLATALYGMTYPYGATYLGGVWSKGVAPMVCALKIGAVYPWLPGVRPYSALASVSYNSGSNPLERGLKFELGMSVRLIGCYLYADLDGAAELRLYDSGDNLLTNGTILSLDPDVRASVSASYQEYFFPATHTLAANSVYRLVLVPTSGSSIALPEYDVNAAAILTGQPGGSDFVHTSRPSGGSFTDTSTKRPVSMGLIVDQIDIGSGGGLIGRANLRGGFL